MSIRAFYFIGAPTKNMTRIESRELRVSISKYFSPLDNLLKGYPIKDATNIKQLREVLNCLEVENEIPLTGEILIDFGIKYNSIILFLYGKWLTKSFGLLTGSDCYQVCTCGNVHMLKFLTNAYTQFTNKFVCEKRNEWSLDTKQVEFWFYCFTGAYNAKYYDLAKYLYKTMLKKSDMEQVYYSCGMDFGELCEIGKLSMIKEFYTKNKSSVTLNDLEYAMAIACKYKCKDICLFLQSTGVINTAV